MCCPRGRGRTGQRVSQFATVTAATCGALTRFAYAERDTFPYRSNPVKNVENRNLRDSRELRLFLAKSFGWHATCIYIDGEDDRESLDEHEGSWITVSDGAVAVG